MSLTNENGGTQFTIPMTPAGGYGGGMGGFGGDGWWGILFLIAIMCGGWGGFGGFGGMGGMMMWPWLFGGFGNGMGGGSAAAQGALTREQACIDNNFNNLARTVEGIAGDIRGLNSTICHQEYETAGLVNGVGNLVQQGFSQAELSRCNQQALLMQQLNQMQASQQQCCCDVRQDISRNNYDAAMRECETNRMIERGFCDNGYAQSNNTNAIIQNAHGDTDRIIARLDAMENARKDETIADLRTKLAACGDQTTAQYIINQLTGIINPRPVPAYPAASPCGLGNWAPQVLANGYGFNGGCCCNG